MDGFEVNKIAGGVLAALLTLFSSKTLLDIALKRPEPTKAGYVIPVTAPAAGAAGAAATAAAPKLNLAEALSKASADSGAVAVTKKCQSCHTHAKGGANAVGPALWGVVNRKIGSVAGFSYSDAVKNKGGEWTFDHLAAYIADPKGYIPGNKMAFAGIKDPGELADVLAYLRTLSDAPALPK